MKQVKKKNKKYIISIIDLNVFSKFIFELGRNAFMNIKAKTDIGRTMNKLNSTYLSLLPQQTGRVQSSRNILEFKA